MFCFQTQHYGLYYSHTLSLSEIRSARNVYLFNISFILHHLRTLNCPYGNPDASKLTSTVYAEKQVSSIIVKKKGLLSQQNRFLFELHVNWGRVCH